MDKHFDGKPCNTCGETLRYIKGTACVACKLNRERSSRKANPDKYRENDRIRYHADLQYQRERSKEWAKANPDKIKEYGRTNRKNNPDKLAAKHAKRRASKLKATTYPEYDWLIQAFYTRARQLTELTGIPHEVEHIIPLHGKNETGQHVVCGLHIPTNLDILPMTENRAKSCKFYDADWHEIYDMAA